MLIIPSGERFKRSPRMGPLKEKIKIRNIGSTDTTRRTLWFIGWQDCILFMDSKKGIICIILDIGLLRKYILIICYYLKLIRIS